MYDGSWKILKHWDNLFTCKLCQYFEFQRKKKKSFFFDSSPFCFFISWMQLQKSFSIAIIFIFTFFKSRADFFFFFFMNFYLLSPLFIVSSDDDDYYYYTKERDRIFQFGSSTITSPSDNFYLLPKFTNSEIQFFFFFINISLGNFYLWREGFLEKYLWYNNTPYPQVLFFFFLLLLSYDCCISLCLFLPGYFNIWCIFIAAPAVQWLLIIPTTPTFTPTTVIINIISSTIITIDSDLSLYCSCWCLWWCLPYLVAAQSAVGEQPDS